MSEVVELGTKIEQAISDLFKPGQLVEVRGKKIGGGIASKYYCDHERMTQVIAKADASEKYEAIWVTLQRLKAGTDTSRTEAQPTTGRADIEAYEWLVIDVDRPKGDPNKKWNATDEELAWLKGVAMKVVGWLSDQGFPEPVFACSGNGCHLLFKLDSLPASYYGTLRDVLRAVAHQFRDLKDICDIDTSLSEPEQVCKIYGTTSRKSPKGSSTGSRPWRESYIEHVPHRIEPVGDSLLEIVAAMAPAEKKSRRSNDGVLNPDFDPYDFFDWGGEYTPLVHEYEKDGATHFVMDNCCLVTEDGLHKHSGDPRKSEFILGYTFGYECFSDDCEGKGIGDVLRKLRELKGESYPKCIWLDSDDDSGFEIEAADDDATEDAGAPEAERESGDASRQPAGSPQAATTAPRSIPSPGAVPQPEATSLDFPENAMYGRLAVMARQMKVPLGLAYPALLGVYSILPDVDEMQGTRFNLFVALVTHVGGGKNVAMERARRMLKLGKMGDRWEPLTAASDRGLMNAVGDKPGKKKTDPRIPGPSKMLLITNEMSEMLKKASIDKSTLAGTLCDLWDQNEKKIADRNGVQSCDCRVSWIGGVPVAKERPEDFSDIFGSETARGLLSRIILGYSAVKFNYRHWEPPAQEIHVPSEGDDYDFTSHIEAPSVNRMSDKAQQMYDAWETAADDSGRLKYNLMKVALLTASANRDDEVTPECMAAAIRFVQWQARLREVFKPSVALETAEAKFAERAMAAFIRKGGQQRAINWKRIANDHKWSDRFGDRVVASGIEWMIKTGRIIPEAVEGEDGRKKKSKHLIRVRVFNKREGNDGA